VRVALLALLLVSPLALAAEEYVVLLDWQSGRSVAGASVLVMSPAAASFPFEVDACHRRLLLDLLYDPAQLEMEAEGVGSFELAYEFLVEAWAGEARLAQQRVRYSGYDHALGLADAAGTHELRISLANGVDVAWEARVRGRAVHEGLDCLPRVVVNEVEANPPGVDAGAEWIELFNADPSETVDLSLWRILSTHGETADLVIPEGVLIAPGARLLIAFDAQFLDNEDESVLLLDAFGVQRDATPVASDLANDDRTWQRVPDGADAWSFGPATPP
jgi:hypothetical protein